MDDPKTLDQKISYVAESLLLLKSIGPDHPAYTRLDQSYLYFSEAIAALRNKPPSKSAFDHAVKVLEHQWPGLKDSAAWACAVERGSFPGGAPLPVELLLWCPSCGCRHIDRGRFSQEPHHTHACQHCGHVWRPAVENTVGVQFLAGFKDWSTGDELKAGERLKVQDQTTFDRHGTRKSSGVARHRIIDIHPEGDAVEHGGCSDPACCSCQCLACKRVWWALDRPRSVDCKGP